MGHVSQVIVAVVLAALTMEVIVRGFYYVPLEIDPVFGYPIVKPGVTAVYRREGSGTSRWTDHGVRRASLNIAAAARPVLVLGDSFTEALMIDDADVYTHRVERLLGDSVREFPVLNVGRSGASPADYVRFAPAYVTTFSPRWTVVQLSDQDMGMDAWSPDKPHFVRDANGRLAVQADDRRERGRAWHVYWRVRQRSALLHFALIRLDEFRQARAIREDPVAAAPPEDPYAAYPIEDELDAVADAYAARVTFVYFPAFDQSKPGTVSSSAERRFDDECRARGWSCVNIRPAYSAFALAGRSPFGFLNSGYNTGHLNAEGHAVAAAALAAELRRLETNGLL